MKVKNKRIFFAILIILFFISTSFVLSFSYPLGQQNPRPGAPEKWTGGVVPDESAYFRWAQIYHETDETYVPLEELGTIKKQNYDFFLGKTPKDCIFVKVEVTKIEDPEPRMKMRNRNIIVTVFNGNDEPLNGTQIKLDNIRLGRFKSGTTGIDGAFTFENVRQGAFIVSVRTKGKPLKIHFATDYQNVNYPIIISAKIINWSATGVKLNIHVDHYINPDINNVAIYLGSDWINQYPKGYTDDQGNFILQLRSKQARSYRIVAIKETENISPPFGSRIVEVDGKYAIANKWAPGYSYFIIPFWTAGLIDFINILALFIVCVGTYIIANRLYNKNTAFIATILVMVCGIGFVMIYQRGMADYAAMAFATLGVALLIESIRDYSSKSKLSLFILLAFLGGLSFAFAVTMRYVTLIILTGPLFFIILKSIKKVKVSNFTRLKKSLPSALAFFIGLAIVGVLLMNYNTILFGGPLNGGHQMGNTVPDIDGNISSSTPDKTMFEDYFNPSFEAFENIFDRILPQLFLLLPTLFIAPIGLCADFKKSRAWLMALWIIPILIVYMQIGWVGKLAVEDMRYFLPILPPTAILSAYAINKTIEYERDNKYSKTLMIMPLILLIIAGFIIADYGIYWILHRQEMGPTFNPPIWAIIVICVAVIIIYIGISRKVVASLNRYLNRKFKK